MEDREAAAVGRDTPAISVAEQDAWFWANYHMSASGRVRGRSTMGIVLLGQDEQNYVLFRWGSCWAADVGEDRAQLIEVVDGQPHVLAEKPGGAVPDQWYKLEWKVGEALDDFQEKQWLKRQCKTKTLFKLKDQEKPDEWWVIKAPFCELAKHKLQQMYGDNLGEIANERLV